MDPSFPAPSPPITYVFSRWRDPPEMTLVVDSSLSIDPLPNELDLPIDLRIGKHLCIYPISFVVTYTHLPFSASLFVASLDSISLPLSIVKALL